MFLLLKCSNVGILLHYMIKGKEMQRNQNPNIIKMKVYLLMTLTSSMQRLTQIE